MVISQFGVFDIILKNGNENDKEKDYRVESGGARIPISGAY